MFRRLLLVPFLVLAVSACVTSGQIGNMPKISDTGEAATVEVLRVSSIIGVVNGYKVSFDGKDIAGIGSGQHFSFKTEPGQHYIAVKCFGGFSPTWKKDSLAFMTSKNKPAYFKISPSGSCATIEQIGQPEAGELRKTSKLLFTN